MRCGRLWLPPGGSCPLSDRSFRRPYCDCRGFPSRRQPVIAQPRTWPAKPATSRTLTGLAAAGLLDQQADLAGLISPSIRNGLRPGMGDAVTEPLVTSALGNLAATGRP